MAEATPKKSLITPIAILSYPSLDIARKSEDSDGPPKFQAALIFTVEAQATPEYKAMQAAAIAAAQAAHPGKDVIELFKLGVDNGGIRSPFRRNWEAKGYPQGSVYINARTTQRPGLVMPDLSKVAPEDIKSRFYAGCIVKASLNAFYYGKKGNKGVSFGLNNMQWIRDGERLDNRADASEEFTADMSATPESIDDLVGGI